MRRLPSAERAIAALAIALSATACGAPSDAERAASSAAPIVGGSASPGADDAVVLLYDEAQSFTCTATVIAPTLVLTARHCVSDVSGDALACDTNGNTVSGGAFGADYPAQEIAVVVGRTRSGAFPPASAHGKAIFHDGAPGVCAHDLAILQLDAALDAPVASVRLHAGPIEGESFDVIGWGTDESTTIAPSRERRDGVSLLAIGATTYDGVPVPPSDFVLGESICDGDSGAPALSVATGALVGVASFGGNGTAPTSDPASTCVDRGSGVINTFTSLSAFGAVFDAAFAAAGGAPAVDDATPAPPSHGSGCAATGKKSDAPSPLFVLAIAALSALSRRFTAARTAPLRSRRSRRPSTSSTGSSSSS